MVEPGFDSKPPGPRGCACNYCCILTPVRCSHHSPAQKPYVFWATDPELCLIHLCTFKPNISLTNKTEVNAVSATLAVCHLPSCPPLPLKNLYAQPYRVTLPWMDCAISFLTAVQAIPQPNMSPASLISAWCNHLNLKTQQKCYILHEEFPKSLSWCSLLRPPCFHCTSLSFSQALFWACGCEQDIQASWSHEVWFLVG